MQSWSRRAILLASAGSLLAACSNGQVGNVPYSVGVDGEGNRLMIVQEPNSDQGLYTATVQSESGIGNASVAWWGKPSLRLLQFQLQLHGLEQFCLIWKESPVRVNVSVNSMDYSVLQGLQRHQEEEVEITPGSPYWIPVDLPTREQQSYLLSAPAAFLADAPMLWAISWIDFYR